MASCHIRPYEDGDYKIVRTIFAQGIMELHPACYFHILKSPQVQLQLLGLFLVMLMASGSILISVIGLALVLTGLWFYFQSFLASFVQEALCGDLRDIRRTYLEAADSCFWVAESNGVVVGMVGASLPLDSSERGNTLEMRRVSVAREHRGKGIARALSRMVLCFAQECRYCTVVLMTSVVQHAAHHLYESLGFQKVREVSPPGLAWLPFSIFHYKYEIPGAR